MVLRFEKSCVLAFFAFTVTTAVVIVEDGGYQNILVTFSPDITKDDQSKVLSETKDLLKLASNAVHKATGIYFRKVVFLLPYTWGNLDNISDAESISLSTANEVYDDANIFIENFSDSVYGIYPYTLQRGGCGTQGVRITIPKDFLNLDKAAEVEKARFIAREWIRYRYGVFYENGYPNDERYPLYFRNPGSSDPTDIQVTGCTDKPMNYTLKNSEGQECSLSVDVSGRPDGLSAACKFHPQEIDSDVSSSLMFLQDLPTVTELCDDQDHVHNADALNKQNGLCNGRSIWNVMKNHPDFENRELRGGTDAPPDPKFKITVDGNPRIVLAVDRSASVKKTTGDIVVTAMEKFILDLPNETEFSLLLFNSIVQEISLSRSRPNLNFVFKGEPSCPSCAIKHGLQVLINGNSGKKGTIVIMSSTDSVDDTVNLSNQLNSQKICLFVILYGSSNSGEGFRELLNASPCSHLWIMPSTEEKTKLHVLTQLNEKLENVIKNHSYHNAMYTVETALITQNNPVSFKTERSIQDFQIRLANIPKIPERAFDDDDIKLTNGKGDEISLQRIQNFEQYRTYEVTSVSDTWNFHIDYINPNELNETFLLQVVAKESNSKSLRVHLWIEDTTTKEGSENSEQLPVILYVEVTMGINPVLDAKVLAVIATPDQDKFDIDLLDNGFGNPDVTKGDGIYSRYFTQFTSKGDYQVTVTISDNDGRSRTALPPDSGPSIPCCGSFIPPGAKKWTGPFERVIKTNFKASSARPSNGYKPLKVQDLRLLSWDDRNLSLQWSSPGNEMDTGAAKEYMFGLFETKQEAETNFENPIRGAFAIAESITPQSYSSKETIQVQLSENLTTDRNYCFAMRSQSKEGRQSDTSNVVQIFIPSAITSPPPTPTKEAIETGDGRSKTSSADTKIIGIVVGVCVLLIIIFIAAYVAFYLIIIRPKRKRNEVEGSPKTPRKTSRDTNEDLGDGTEPANEWQMENNGISPINSWPSNVLVNHHQKVKEAKRKNEMPPVFTLEQLETSADKINTISNGLLPNPIYSSRADDLRDHEKDTSTPPLRDYDNIRPSKRVTHV